MNNKHLFTILMLIVFLLVPLSVYANNGCNINILEHCININNVRAHQAALQSFADATNGTRYASTQGYYDSVDYVVEQLEAAGGYTVTVQEFQYNDSYVLNADLIQLSPIVAVYVYGDDFLPMDFTAEGSVTAAVTAVDLALVIGNASSSGCDAADFAGFPVGHIALMQRGTCAFQIKAENAAAAGASAAIIMNQGNTAGIDRQGLFGGTLSAAYAGGIPVVSTSYPFGVQLASFANLTMQMAIDTETGIATTYNVFADSVSGNANSVVMLGAHLDSVDTGPGIQDNGSGSTAILEAAIQIAGEPVVNRLRFAWWGAEESGLVGSNYYIANLPLAERNKIKMYLNFDMIASPNYFLGVYDGDGSAFNVVGPAGSEQIEHFFTSYFFNQNLATAPTEISFRSDYAAFFRNGIPFGGLFTGAEGIKTAEEAVLWGGTAGQQYDPCYHRACDTYDNVSVEALTYNTRAISAAITYFASNRAIAGNHRQRRNYNALAETFDDHHHEVVAQ
jgi:Zn-dependent M28 family amino/carboxypeptidase